MKFTKVSLLTLILSILLLSACTQKNLEFSGESNNWFIYYEVIENVGTSGYIEYLGEKPVPELMEYSIGSSSGSIPMTQDGVHNLATTRCDNCATPNKDSEIKAIIKWDNKSEKIPLIVD